MTRLQIAVISALSLVGVATAQETPSDSGVMKSVLDDASMEYATCAAYFAIVKEAIPEIDPEDSSLGAQYTSAAQTAKEKAVALAEVVRTREMAEKIVDSRAEMAARVMRDEIDNDLANIEILIADHLDRCQRALNDPSAVLDEKFAEAMHESID